MWWPACWVWPCCGTAGAARNWGYEALPGLRFLQYQVRGLDRALCLHRRCRIPADERDLHLRRDVSTFELQRRQLGDDRLQPFEVEAVHPDIGVGTVAVLRRTARYGEVAALFDPQRTVEGDRRLAIVDEVEVVERKGAGHPDTICDALAEEFSRNLCREYLRRTGRVLHHNVDKALLCGGAARPAFGGGELLEPIEIHLAGRAVREFKGVKAPVEEIAVELGSEPAKVEGWIKGGKG